MINAAGFSKQEESYSTIFGKDKWGFQTGLNRINGKASREGPVENVNQRLMEEDHPQDRR